MYKTPPETVVQFAQEEGGVNLSPVLDGYGSLSIYDVGYRSHDVRVNFDLTVFGKERVEEALKKCASCRACEGLTPENGGRKASVSTDLAEEVADDPAKANAVALEFVTKQKCFNGAAV